MTAVSELVVVAPYSAKRGIQGITGQVVIREQHTDELSITSHPVEQGAAISDHAYKEPASLVLEYGWTNSKLSNLLGVAGSLLSGNGLGDLNYCRTVYAQLLALQVGRTPVRIVTGKRSYKNMLIKALAMTTDADTENAMIVRATCEEVILVQTSATTVPPRDVQANPASTASPENMGTKQTAPAPTANVSALAQIVGG